MRVKDILLLAPSSELIAFLEQYNPEYFVALDQNDRLYIIEDYEHNSRLLTRRELE